MSTDSLRRRAATQTDATADAAVAGSEPTPHQHGKGQIRDNAQLALLHDALFRPRIEHKRKGKGSFKRQAKHRQRGWDRLDQQGFVTEVFLIGLVFHQAKIGCGCVQTEIQLA